MSTLSKNSPYYKKFLNGDFGHSHAVQEFFVWLILVGLTAWYISPPVAILVVIFLELYADHYWLRREVNQSLAMGRTVSLLEDAYEVPQKPNKFWTQDAINDVLFPRKLRKVWVVLSFIAIAILLYKFGIKGVLVQ